MATATHIDRSARLRDPSYQAFLLLRTVFTVAPILFGLDKFTNLMTDWTMYLAPWIDGILPGDAATAMHIVGVIEIVAGILVAVAPRIGADIARELALGLLIKPLHLRHESLEWFCDFLFGLAAKLHFDRLAIRAEVNRGFECFRQIGERHAFVHIEVFDQRILQMAIVDAHAFRATPPGRDCSFGQRFSLVGDHQLRIDHQLCSQTVASRASAEVAVERKMSRCQLA